MPDVASATAPSGMKLSPGYRLTTSKSCALKHLNDIFRILTTDERVYWARHRTLDVVRRQIESSWTFVTVLYDEREAELGQKSTGDDELVGRGEESVAGIARVIADGEAFGYLADVVIVQAHEGKGLARAIVTEAVDNCASPGSVCSSLDWKWLLFTRFPTMYSKLINFKDPVPRGWAMLRWPTTPPRERSPPLKLPQGYAVSCDKEVTLSHLSAITDVLLDHPLVYWGKNRTRDVVARQFQRCEAVTVVHTDESSGKTTLVGFARVVTDNFDFAYIADVFVLPEHGGRGLAKAMIQTAVEDLGGPGKSINWKWTLFTNDAHSLYEKFGFERAGLEGQAVIVMERFPKA
ncbi:hypothetical protein ACM66B_006092 [Microbotryomycetes sp. NB124-2]